MSEFIGSSLKAKDVMTREVVTVSPSTSLKALARVLVEHNITGAPVVNASGDLVGRVSQTDLLLSQLAAQVGRRDYEDIFDLFSASPSVWEEPEMRHGPGPRWVEDIMTKHVVVAGEELSVEELASLMAERGIHRVPIVTEGKLVGIVAALDLLKVLSRGVGQGQHVVEGA